MPDTPKPQNPSDARMSRDETIIWAAGFLEGEGFFAIKNNKGKVRKDGTRRSYTSWQIGAAQVNPEPLVRLKELFGGRIHKRKQFQSDGVMRRAWSGWDLNNRDAILEVTRLIAPYLSEDRKSRIPWLEDALRNTDDITHDQEGDLESIAPERFRLMRLCVCGECGGTGKGSSSYVSGAPSAYVTRCPHCRGEGRELQEVATCATPEAVGVALVTLGREGEWAECPIGVLDSEGAKGEKWIVRPWMPSARNVSDAGRTLARSKNTSPSQ